MEPDRSWTSPSDLADWAYCPRAHYYHGHPPVGGPSGPSQERARSGTRYHSRVLGAERRRSELGGAYWATVVLGGLLVAGGLAWILFRP